MSIISANDARYIEYINATMQNAMAEITARGQTIHDVEAYRFLMDQLLPMQMPDDVPLTDVAQWHPNMSLERGVTAAVAIPHGDGPFPVLVHAHGHGLMAGHSHEFEPWMRVLASHGFVVVFPDYSHMPEVPYEQIVEEMQVAIDWVRTNGATIKADPARMVLGGDSAGGGLAFDVLLRNLAREDGARFCAFEGMDANVDGQIMARKGLPSILEQLNEDTPLPPIILVVGTADFTFPAHLRVTTKLNELKKHFDWHVYYGMPHDFAKFPKMEIARKANQRMMEFLACACQQQ
jgi:acetyl esterase/lipase